MALPRLLRGMLLAACLPLALLAVPAAVFAATEDEVREQSARLEELRRRIGALKEELREVRGSRDARQTELEKTDKAIGRLGPAMRQTRKQIEAAEGQLSGLEQQRQVELDRLAGTRALLQKEMRASYMAGRQQRVKLLLNQEDPAALARMLVYQGYFTRARSRHIQAYKAALDQLEETEQALAEQHAALQALYGEQSRQSEELAARQQQQREILAKIERQLSDKSAELKQLEQDEARLGQLVASLRRALQDMPMGKLDRPLKSLKGKLSWPVAGRIVRNYGERLAVGNARSRGLLIATNPDSEVRAIAKGRVAFADWLRGFGLLMIIEHGDGYMSLYGHNNSLYRGVGEWVEQGDVIAAAGNSGGQRSSSLYLELRKNGRTIDPRVWFRGKPRSQTAGARAGQD